MAQLRDVSEPVGFEYELRLAERRRVDRQERLQFWIAILLAGWILTQIATLAMVAVTFDVVFADREPAWRIRPIDIDWIGPAARISGAIALGFCLMTFAIASALGLMALGYRKLLPATWFTAAALPWLILIIETAVVTAIVVGSFA